MPRALDDLHPIEREMFARGEEAKTLPGMTAEQYMVREGITDPARHLALASCAGATVRAIVEAGEAPELGILGAILLGIRLARKGLV